jgi:hypothetical protein
VSKTGTAGPHSSDRQTLLVGHQSHCKEQQPGHAGANAVSGPAEERQSGGQCQDGQTEGWGGSGLTGSVSGTQPPGGGATVGPRQDGEAPAAQNREEGLRQQPNQLHAGEGTTKMQPGSH